MKVRKIPMRMCALTREKYPKQELIRIVRTPEGTVVVDPTGKQNGHGVYLKKDKEVFATAKKKKTLEKALETSIPDEVYETLDTFL